MHLAPALATAFTGIMGRDSESESIDKKVIALFFRFNLNRLKSLINQICLIKLFLTFNLGFLSNLKNFK